jgi:hypothetical protein
VSALEVTGSALSSSLLTVSGSGYATSASLSTASGSFNSRVATIESKYATTGSNTFIGTQVVSGSVLQSGSFTTTGTIIAQTINVQQVTSSVVYSSGSNVFGNSIGNSQTFTGSVLVTGSLTIAGASSATSYNGATIFGSTIACSPIGCFATSCATSFIGGTLSGTTIYGSTAVCSANGLLIGNGGVTATCNYLPKFTGASTIGNSLVYDNGTNVGIGTASPNGKLTINSSSDNNLRLENGSELAIIRVLTTGALDIWSHGDTANEIFFRQGTGSGTVKMTLDASGNLGLGVTPSAWYSTMKAITVQGSNGNGSSWYSGGSQDLVLFANGYYDAAATPTRNGTGGTAQYRMTNAQHSWWIDATTTGAISLTQAMTLTAAGNLGIGTNSPDRLFTIAPTSGDSYINLKRPVAASTQSTLEFNTAGTSDWLIRTDDASANLKFYSYGLSNYALTLLRSSGAATFSSSVLTGGDITVSKSGDSGINLNSTTTNGVAVTRYQTTAAGNLWGTGINITAGDSRWEVYNFATGVSPFRIASTGAASFAGTGNGIPLIIQDISAAITGQTAGYIGMSTSAFSGNNGDLVLYPRTSATSKILLMGGNVGIGITAPPTNLSVKGSPSVPTAATYNGIFGLETAGQTSFQMGILNSVGNGTWFQTYNQPATGGGTFNLYFNPLGGNVLIGGTSDIASGALVVGDNSSTRPLVLRGSGGVDGAYTIGIGLYPWNTSESNAILSTVSSVASNSGFRFDVSNGGSSTARTASMYINRGGITVVGSLAKGSGSFRIDHPLESMTETYQLVHSFIEGPQADLIYRGKLTLVNGKAQANIDEVSTMTEGTFEALCREVQCFTTNESGWDLVKGKVIGNIIYIESQNTNSTDEISWMVIGERKDKHIMDTDWTDENGKVIVEPLKRIEVATNKK